MIDLRTAAVVDGELRAGALHELDEVGFAIERLAALEQTARNAPDDRVIAAWVRFGRHLSPPRAHFVAWSAALATAEADGRRERRGVWNESNVIKNTESSGDILAGIGRFTIVEGKVLSVRQAGATTYLNFGRNWTQDFAVTISRRIMPAIEAAGIAPKSLENRRIRVRGWVEARPGPRIDVQRAAQLEILSDNERQR